MAKDSQNTDDPTPDQAEAKAKKRWGGRSPNFPAMSLEKAIAKTAQLDVHPVPITLLPSRWEYSNVKNSRFQQAVAALSAYGLINIQGTGDKRVITLSDRGKRIIKNAPDRDAQIRDAALAPAMIRELWDKFSVYEELPKDDIIKSYLVWDRDPKFLEPAAEALIATFRETISFAKLSLGEVSSTEDDEEGSGNADDTLPPQTKQDGSATASRPAKPKPKPSQGREMPAHPPDTHKNFMLPLIGGDVAVIQVPHPMTEANFNILTSVLNAMKSALVSEAPQKNNASANDGSTE
jgi:hypothetical protein